MINDNTILSSFDDRPTLLEWLKKVEDALKTDTATAVSVENPSANTYVFKITFADGDSISSGNVVFPDSVKDVSIKNGHIIVTMQSGHVEDLGEIGGANPYDGIIVINSATNTTEIDNNVEVGGNLQVNGSISSAYNHESSIIVNETPVDGLSISLVDGVNFVKEKDDLIEVHAYVKITKTSGSTSSFDGMTISSSFVPSHEHTYLIPFGQANGAVSGYMYAHVYKTGVIRIGDWNGIANGDRWLYLDLMYYRH